MDDEQNMWVIVDRLNKITETIPAAETRSPHFLCAGAASCEQHRRINLLLALVHSHSNNTAVLRATNAKLAVHSWAVHTRPSCATH
jgi:hypothetical protein